MSAQTVYTLMQLALALGGILLVLVAVQNRALLEKCERLGKDNAALAEALNAATGELGQVRDERDAVREELKDEIVRSGELLRENKIWAQEAREREAFKVEARRVMGRRWLS